MSYTFNNHELKELFNELDTDGDGIVDLNEDINKYDKFPLLQEIFKTIGDRKLKFEDFKKEITDLLNDKGRVCTYKRNKIYCNGKFQKEDNQNGIVYSYNYVCGHSGQCDACKKLSKHYELYFDKNLLEKLRKRDELLLK